MSGVQQQHTNEADIAIKPIPNFGIDDDNVSTKKNEFIHMGGEAGYTKAPGVDDMDQVDYAKSSSSDSQKSTDFSKEVSKKDQDSSKLSKGKGSKQSKPSPAKADIPVQHTDPSDISVQSIPDDGIEDDDVSTQKNANIHYTKAPGADQASDHSSPIQKESNKSSEESNKSSESGPRRSHRKKKGSSSKGGAAVVQQHTDEHDIAVSSLPNTGIDDDEVSTLKNAEIHYTKAPGVEDDESESSSFIGEKIEQAKGMASQARDMASQATDKAMELIHQTKEKGKKLVGTAKD